MGITPESNTKIEEAVAVIDGALGNMFSRELVSTGEVADLLLDVRGLISPLVSLPEEIQA